MDENEQAIIQKIRSHKNPDQAMRVVSDIILSVIAEPHEAAKPVISANAAKIQSGDALQPSYLEEPYAKGQSKRVPPATEGQKHQAAFLQEV